jgi:hypothetical protein
MWELVNDMSGEYSFTDYYRSKHFFSDVLPNV